ncbi:hypothetical protein V8G54_031135 [Vigna mungo]|uniref:Uncharacterized protein n=1 Tax=Vigna mungo TaxID=3915 RepID=A0AAQ3MY97_VIGMU
MAIKDAKSIDILLITNTGQNEMCILHSLPSSTGSIRSPRQYWVVYRRLVIKLTRSYQIRIICTSGSQMFTTCGPTKTLLISLKVFSVVHRLINMQVNRSDINIFFLL